MADGMTMTLKGGDGLKAHLAKLQGQTGVLRAGILEGSTYPDGTPTAFVAAANEFGTIHIPPRPFMRTAVSKNGKRWAGGFGKLIKKQGFNYLKSLGLLGEQVKADIKVSVATWASPPNAASTQRQKGFNAPLRDTGHMMRSVAYEVTK